MAGCSGASEPPAASGPQDLETAAIERGLVRDASERELTGLYARDTDRVCVVPQGGRYRIGVFVDYGDALSCSASGTATRSGDTVRVVLGGDREQGCSIDAKFDGDRLTFPAILSEDCAKLCGPRATFAALDVERLSESVGEARALRTATGERLCGG